MVYVSDCEKYGMRIVEFFMEGINVCGDEVELRGGDRYDLMWESEVERMLKICEKVLEEGLFVEEDSWGVLRIGMI
jgi:hypothetical protein